GGGGEAGGEHGREEEGGKEKARQEEARQEADGQDAVAWTIDESEAAPAGGRSHPACRSTRCRRPAAGGRGACTRSRTGGWLGTSCPAGRRPAPGARGEQPPTRRPVHDPPKPRRRTHRTRRPPPPPPP